MKNSKPGYVLVLTLMIISVSLILITTVYQRYFSYQSAIGSLYNREQAKMLALGGVQVGLAQLALVNKKAGDQNNESQNGSNIKQNISGDNTQINSQDESFSQDQLTDQKESPEQKWLTQVLPLINRWQTIELSDDITGVDGTLKLYIASEEGKINLNQFVVASSEGLDNKNAQEQSSQATTEKDPSSNEDKKSLNDQDGSLEENIDKKRADQKLNSKGAINKIVMDKFQVNIESLVNNLYKKLGRYLIDPTELVTEKLPESITKNIFFNYPTDSQNSDDYYFMDIFTTFSKSYNLNPWLLSASTLKILGFSVPAGDSIKKIVKSFKSEINLEKDFISIFGPVYGIKNNENTQLIIFNNKFEVEAFSIVSYATCNNARVGVCAIVERITQDPSYSKESFAFRIKRLYWL